MSPHNGSASRHGCSSSAALPRGLTMPPWGSARWEAGEILKASNTAVACNRQEIQQQGHHCSLALWDAR